MERSLLEIVMSLIDQNFFYTTSITSNTISISHEVIAEMRENLHNFNGQRASNAIGIPSYNP